MLLQVEYEAVDPELLVEGDVLLLLELVEVREDVDDAFQDRGVEGPAAEPAVDQTLSQLHVLDDVLRFNPDLRAKEALALVLHPEVAHQLDDEPL